MTGRPEGEMREARVSPSDPRKGGRDRMTDNGEPDGDEGGSEGWGILLQALRQVVAKRAIRARGLAPSGAAPPAGQSDRVSAAAAPGSAGSSHRRRLAPGLRACDPRPPPASAVPGGSARPAPR